MLESHYVLNIQNQLETNTNIRCLKVHGDANTPIGTPDIFVCVSGQLVVIEVKVNGNRPTEKQLYELDKWAAVGAISFWICDLDPKVVQGFVDWVVKYRLANNWKASNMFRYLTYIYWQRELEFYIERHK
jgi:hypothetical protein